MKIQATQGGGVVNISDERAERLLQSRDWKRVTVDSPVTPEPEFDDVVVPESEDAADETNEDSKGEDTREENSDVEKAPEATTAEIRAWARENTDLNVPSKGALPLAAREAYENAHTN